MNKLIEHNAHARGIVERIMCPYKIEDVFYDSGNYIILADATFL